jgi:hypothetical protein
MNFQPIPGFTKEQNEWLYKIFKISPQAYTAAVDEYKFIVREMNLSGLGIDWGGIFSKVADVASKVAAPVIQLKQAKDQLALQKKQLAADTRVRTAALQAGAPDPGAVFSNPASIPAPAPVAYDPYAAQYPQGAYQYQSGGGFSLSSIPPVALLAVAAGLTFLLVRGRRK